MSIPDKSDVVIKLWTLKDDPELFENLRKKGYEIKRAMSPNISYIMDFIKQNFPPETVHSSWADEALPALLGQHCFICTKGEEIVGFMCCEATTKDFVGPLGVSPEHRGNNIAGALYISICKHMMELGYKYAIGGWMHEGGIKVFEKYTEFVVIPGASEGSYKDMI